MNPIPPIDDLEGTSQALSLLRGLNVDSPLNEQEEAELNDEIIDLWEGLAETITNDSFSNRRSILHFEPEREKILINVLGALINLSENNLTEIDSRSIPTSFDGLNQYTLVITGSLGSKKVTFSTVFEVENDMPRESHIFVEDKDDASLTQEFTFAFFENFEAVNSKELQTYFVLDKPIYIQQNGSYATMVWAETEYDDDLDELFHIGDWRIQAALFPMSFKGRSVLACLIGDKNLDLFEERRQIN